MVGVQPRAVLFRCDASSEIGLGHIVRCHALADELARHGLEPWFATRSPDGLGLNEIRRHGHRIIPTAEPSPDEVSAIESATVQPSFRRRRFRAVVMDHYDLDARWLVEAQRLADRLVVIDDLANRALPCDLLVNGNLGFQPTHYAELVPPRTNLLLGPRYALLRSNVAVAHAETMDRQHGEIRTVLMTFGGTDQSRVIAMSIEAVRLALPDAAIDLVVGSSRGVPGSIDHPALRIHVAVGDDVMTRLMLDADLAIGAGGMTALERCAVGLPSIAIRLAPNQDVVVNGLLAAGATVDAGPVDGLAVEALAAYILAVARDPGIRSELATRGWELIDGRGAIRVAHHIEGVKVRQATLRDAHRLWAWRNDPDVRAASTRSGRIPFEDHLRWLRDTLRDPARLLLVGWNGAGQLGQVRFDRQDNEAEVSISVAPEHRGTVGGLLLRAGIRHFRRKWPQHVIRARVKADNEPSRRLFEHAGFELESRTQDLMDFRLVGAASQYWGGKLSQ